MKNLFFAFLFLPFFSVCQSPNYDNLCRNIYETPETEVEGDTLYMYITCSKDNSEEFEQFVRKYLLIMSLDESITSGQYDLYTRVLYQQGGMCQTWQVIFIKTKTKEDWCYFGLMKCMTNTVSSALIACCL